jgi:hypothetical protein
MSGANDFQAQGARVQRCRAECADKGFFSKMAFLCGSNFEIKCDEKKYSPCSENFRLGGFNGLGFCCFGAAERGIQGGFDWLLQSGEPF